VIKPVSLLLARAPGRRLSSRLGEAPQLLDELRAPRLGRSDLSKPRHDGVDQLTLTVVDLRQSHRVELVGERGLRRLRLSDRRRGGERV
jgi:hypothetical protein